MKRSRRSQRLNYGIKRFLIGFGVMLFIIFCIWWVASGFPSAIQFVNDILYPKELVEKICALSWEGECRAHFEDIYWDRYWDKKVLCKEIKECDLPYNKSHCYRWIK